MKPFKSSLTTLLIVCTLVMSSPAMLTAQRRPSPVMDTGRLFFFEARPTHAL